MITSRKKEPLLNINVYKLNPIIFITMPYESEYHKSINHTLIMKNAYVVKEIYVLL